MYSGKKYNYSNYDSINKQISVIKPGVEVEIQYINQLKDHVISWEQLNKPKILRDAYNLKVNNSNRYNKPIKGGFITLVFPVEPKVLLNELEHSTYTSIINDYIFDSLLQQDLETFEWKPSLAESYTLEDVVWLKGKKNDNIFKEKGENNYLIGIIDETKIQWDRNKKNIIKLPVTVDGNVINIQGDQLRYKIDPVDKYRRAYDKSVIFTFNLRQNIKWHDGEKFTAEDVIFTLNTLMNPYIPEFANSRFQYQFLKHWEKIGNYKIKLFFDKQYFKSISIASGINVWPKHIYLGNNQKMTPKEFAKYFTEHKVNHTPVGTGPYYIPSKFIKNKKISLEQEKNRITLIRNDEYFDNKNHGYLKKITFRFVTRSETSMIMFKNGKIDFDPSITTETLLNSTVSEKFKSQYVKALYYNGGYSYIGYNMKKEYFKDRRVRQAITMLLDRELILKKIYHNFGVIVTGSQYIFGPAYNSSIKPFTYNRDKAIQLLNEAGWIDTDGDGVRDKNGIPFEIQLMYAQGSTSGSAIGRFLYEELRSVGIKLQLTQIEWAVFLKQLSERTFDMCLLGWSTDIESDEYQIWHSTQWANQGSNHVGFDNKEADKLIEKARYTLNDQKRWEIYKKLHEIIHKEQPYLFLYNPIFRAIYNNRYRNVKFYKRRPGYNLKEWYVPKSLQTVKERQAEIE